MPRPTKEQAKQKKLQADYDAVFLQNPRGRTVLRDLMAQGYFFKPAIQPTERETCFALGAQNLVHYILAQIQYANIKEPSEFMDEAELHKRETVDDFLQV